MAELYAVIMISIGIVVAGLLFSLLALFFIIPLMRSIHDILNTKLVKLKSIKPIADVFCISCYICIVFVSIGYISTLLHNIFNLRKSLTNKNSIILLAFIGIVFSYVIYAKIIKKRERTKLRSKSK